MQSKLSSFASKIFSFSPVCSKLPWGDKNLISSNVYQHIKSRHRFDYGKKKNNQTSENVFFFFFRFFLLDTYVNYEQDEETMMREALQASLLNQ